MNDTIPIVRHREAVPKGSAVATLFESDRPTDQLHQIAGSQLSCHREAIPQGLAVTTLFESDRYESYKHNLHGAEGCHVFVSTPPRNDRATYMTARLLSRLAGQNKRIPVIASAMTILLTFLAFNAASAQDWPNLKRYRAANEKLKDSTTQVVYMGDSITDFWLDADPGFFKQNHYANRGISGQTSPQMLLRFRQDVIALKPKAVVILCGTNDIAGNTGPMTPEMTEDNIRSMTELAKANKIKVILCSVLPANHFGWKPNLQPADSIIALNTWVKTYAKEKHFGYVDYYSALVDEQKGFKTAYSQDGVHPNAAGYAVMEPLVQKAIKKEL